MAAKDSRTPPPETPIWAKPAPGKLMGRGHSAGDLLEAYDWDVLESRDGLLRVGVHLPARLRNPKGEDIGGFTPSYVDLLEFHN